MNILLSVAVPPDKQTLGLSNLLSTRKGFQSPTISALARLLLPSSEVSTVVFLVALFKCPAVITAFSSVIGSRVEMSILIGAVQLDIF